jgi:hypothetical protein
VASGCGSTLDKPRSGSDAHLRRAAMMLSPLYCYICRYGGSRRLAGIGGALPRGKLGRSPRSGRGLAAENGHVQGDRWVDLRADWGTTRAPSTLASENDRPGLAYSSAQEFHVLVWLLSCLQPNEFAAEIHPGPHLSRMLATIEWMTRLSSSALSQSARGLRWANSTTNWSWSRLMSGMPGSVAIASVVPHWHGHLARRPASATS